MRPIGGPIRHTSPTLTCETIARLTQPPGTVWTWNSSTQSGPGAFAGDSVRHIRGRWGISTETYWPAR